MIFLLIKFYVDNKTLFVIKVHNQSPFNYFCFAACINLMLWCSKILNYFGFILCWLPHEVQNRLTARIEDWGCEWKWKWNENYTRNEKRRRENELFWTKKLIKLFIRIYESFALTNGEALEAGESVFNPSYTLILHIVHPHIYVNNVNISSAPPF